MKAQITWEGAPVNIEPYFGFVYLITNKTNDRKYIGRKYFFKRRRVAVKGKKRKKLTVTESDWKTYTGSCDELNLDIKKLGHKNFTFKIISCHKTRAEVNYTEVKEQFIRDVLNAKLDKHTHEYYNTNILSRYFRGKI